ncbi:MAG: HEAT repeat domain-containing protein [Acidobacteria bacterium]|nr:HEAT repeat domain-containing protein [Acidobacteriota bacterium]
MAKVFLSSTSKDLREYRVEVANAINGLPGFECIQMETWGAVNATPTDYDATKVADCDLFVLLLGAIYGECKLGTEKSFTELEYDQAVELDRPRIAFFASDNCLFPLSVTKDRPAGDSERLEAFRERVRQERIKAEFTDPHQLANQITKAILKWQEESRQACLDRFLRHTIENNSEISLRGVMQAERQVAVKLDEVYVSLKTERKVYEPYARHGFFVDEFGRVKGTFTNALLSDFGEEGDVVPIPGSRVRWAERETRAEKVDLAEAVRENRRMVILGDPGAGKTTLMRFLALHFARTWRGGFPIVIDKDGTNYGKVRLPIFMRVADFAEELRKNRNAKLRDCLLVPFRNIERNSDGELTRLLEEKLRRGEALLLLDGLDEVTEPSDRVVIVQQIEEFVRSTHSDNRVIVTSRIVGYRQAPLGNDYQHFTLLDLEREQIEKFLNGWCLAVERFHAPDASTEIIADRAKVEIDDILKSVDGNTGVKRLATNPLLLTILALIHRNGSRLPSRRVELYELATNTLLADWQAAKGMDGSKLISKSDAAQFLWPLAYWMHSERPRGLAYEQEVEEKLREVRSRDTGKPSDHPEVIAAVDGFLARARGPAGIFVERAPKQYGFLHLTFQEYFAALQLMRNSLQAAQRINEVRHKPRWEEPILLAVASRQSPDDGDLLVRAAILAEGEFAERQGFTASEYEHILHRDLFLSARCLADDVAVYPNLRCRIINRLCDLYFDVRSSVSLKGDIRQIFGLVAECAASADLIPKLLKRLDDTEWAVRSAAVYALGAMGKKAENDQVITALIQRLADSKMAVQIAAAGILGTMGEKIKGDLVISKLIQLLGNSEHFVRSWAANTLGAIGEKASSDQVVFALIERLADSDFSVQRAAARALVAIGRTARDQAITASIERSSSSDSRVRLAAARALGWLGKKEVVPTLIRLCGDSQENVRRTAIWALGDLGEKAASEQVISTLVRLLADSQSGIRLAAARALEKFGEEATSDQTISALVQLLTDSDGDVRSTAAQALGMLGEKAVNNKVVFALIERLGDSEGFVRCAAVGALGVMGKTVAGDQVISVLTQCLTDPEWDVRSAAVRALELMGEEVVNENAISDLIERLADSEEVVRIGAAMSLGAMGKAASNQIISALINSLSDSSIVVATLALGALDELSMCFKEEDKSEIIKLALPLACNKRRGEKNDRKRDAGYLMLRNLLADKYPGEGA